MYLLIGNFTHTPDDVYACAGDDVILDWQFSGSASYVHWTSNNGKTNMATYVNSSIFLTNTFSPHSGYFGRVEWSGNGNITIKNVQTGDSGAYVCEISGSTYGRSIVEVYVYSKFLYF